MNTNENKTGLEMYVSKVFKEFETDRKCLELKWEDNINAFNKTLDQKFKKDEKGKSKKDDWRSKTFIGITKQKCISAHAIIMDTIMQGDKLPYFLDESDVASQQIEQIPKEEMEAQTQQKELMTATINEQMKECRVSEKFSKNVLSAAIYGETYGKQTVKTIKKSGYGYEPQEDGSEVWTKLVEEYDYPNYEDLSIWDVFRDIEADDLQSGRAVIHRQMVSPFDLRKMKGEFVLKDKINSVISEHQGDYDEENTASLRPAEREIKNRKKKITLIEYWGRVPSELAQQFEDELTKTQKKKDFSVKLNDTVEVNEEDGREVEVMIKMANHQIISYVKTDEGERPFYRSVWEEPIDAIGGNGIADNLIEIQKLLNGSVRSFEDNKKLTANAMFAVKRRFLLDQPDTFVPGKMIDLSEECDDARQAIQQLNFADVGESAVSMINLAQQFADDESSVPRVQQGAGGSGRETAFELSQRLEKSGKYLAKIIKNFDTGIIQPVVAAFLDHNMDDEEAEGKGNYKVVANGFSSFQSRVTRLAGIRQAIEMINGDEELSKSVKREEMYKEFTELLDIDTDRWFMNKEDEEARIQAEQEQAEVERQAQQLSMDKLQAEIDLEKAKKESLIAETKMKAEELKLKMLEEANKLKEGNAGSAQNY